MLHFWWPVPESTAVKYLCLNCDRVVMPDEINDAPPCKPDPEPEEYDPADHEEDENPYQSRWQRRRSL